MISLLQSGDVGWTYKSTTTDTGELAANLKIDTGIPPLID
jgi:hypothetical protein